MRKRPGRGRGQAAKGRRRHGVPKTGTYGAKQEGAAEAKQPRAHPGRNKEHGLPPDRIIRGQAAAERNGLDLPGWIKQHEPPQPGLDHPVMQWGKQEAEAEVKVSSSHEDEAKENQSGSKEEEPVVMQ